MDLFASKHLQALAGDLGLRKDPMAQAQAFQEPLQGHSNAALSRLRKSPVVCNWTVPSNAFAPLYGMPQNW